MTVAIVGLAILVLVLAVLLLSLNANTAWPWQIKAGAIVASMLTVAIGYFAVYRMLGLPTNREVPDNARLLWADVIEPRKGHSKAGAIYLWTKPAGEEYAPPRAYELPYDRELHDMVMAAIRRAETGIRQGIRINLDYDASKQGEGRGLPVNFYDIKPPTLPAKTDRRLGEQ